MPQGIAIIKDIISLFVYLVFCPLRKNKKAILVYHSVDYIADKDDPDKINVSPALFEKHMAYLSGKKGITVSFDDGCRSVYRNAFAVIKKYAIKAKLFLVTDFIDRKASLGRQGPLSWDEVKQMGAAGVELGSHSLSHRVMSGLSDDALYLEAAASKKRIEDLTGQRVDSFAYPFGHSRSFNQRTQKALRAAGYNKVYLNIMGMDNSASRPFAIRRIRVYARDNMFRFRMKISGAYNWADYLAWLI